MYEDRDLESFASDRASKTIQAMFQNVSTIHRGLEIELQSQVSLSRE